MNFDFRRVDIAFKNGKIITVDAQDTIAQAVGVKGNKIVFVGTDAELDTIIDEGTQVIDLEGRTLTPGFIDSHFHPILSGFMGGAIKSAYYPGIKSIAQLKAFIREEAAKVPKGSWIKLWGYDQDKFEERRHPTIEDLDEAAPDHPVQCMRLCGHVCIYNTKALEAADIRTAADASRFGPGEVEVQNGKLTGKLYDLAVFHVWSKVVYTEQEVTDAIKRSNDRLLSTGITSVHDAGATDKQSYSAMFKAARSGAFKPREFMMLHSIFGKPFSAKDNERFIENGFHTGLGDEHFRIGTCKFMIDGGSSGPSCAVRQPYTSNPDSCGVLSWQRDEVRDYIQYINDNDNQCTAHAVGDLAIEFMVEGYEHALKVHPRKPEEHRHRIEHCGIVDADLVSRMGKMGIVPVVNACFFPFNGSAYVRNFGDRVNWLYALRSMIDAGLRPTISCDAPSAPIEVALGLDGAMNRTDRRTGEVVGGCQRVSLLEAIRCYTLNGAYASFEDDIKGSVEVGKLADLAVFDRDIQAIPADQIGEAQIDLTMLDGKVVYERGKGVIA